MTDTTTSPGDLVTLGQRLARLTPEQRARLVRLARERSARPAPITRVDRSTGRLPMSSAQRRLYFLQKLLPESPAYNNVEAVRIRGRVDIDAMRAALASVVARHEVLRTTAVPDAEPVLALAEPAVVEALTVDTVDVASVAELRAECARRADRPFDVDSELPVRVTLARLADDDHGLLFVTHHMATDAWSCRLLVREFFQAYQSVDSGPLDLQYADFAGWQRDQLGGPEMAEHLRYWRERLAGVSPVLELPLDRPRPAVRSDHGAERHIDLDTALRRRLHAAARDAAVTPFAVLLTAFGYVLHRYCATEDVVVGTPVAGRDRVETEPLIGCFINTVVLRLDLSAAPTRRALVRRIWDATLADFEHQSLPFEHLVAELNPERDLSVAQLVQVLFNYYPATELSEPVPGLDVRPLDVPRHRAKFDLTCNVVDARDGIKVTVNYATDLLAGEQVERIGELFVAVLEALVGDLDAPAATLPPVPPDEAVVVAPPAPVVGPPALTRFEAHVRADPDRVAVRTPTAAVSYAELDERASRLGRLLSTTDTPVALLFERDVDYVVAILAALKAGRTYVPLDPTMPDEHVDAVVAAAGAELLTPAALVGTYAADRLTPAVAGPGPARPDDAMYVLFTSGSTGRPKGVVVEHRHLSAYLDSVVTRLDLPDGLHYALVSTFAADLGLTNLFGALTTGGTVHVLPYEWAADPPRFADYFRRHRIDVMKLVPSHLAAVAEAGLLADVVPARHLVLAGEACPWDLVAAVRAARPQCTVWNHYGPTETTVSVLAYRVPDDLPGIRGATVPLGHPLDHVQVSIVDSQLRPVPRGAAGELFIAGASVARGYLSAEDGSDRFTAGGYRSGDRARIRTDGTVEFLGRLDRQVKLRGYRVEPSHVEAVLRRHPAVGEVAVAVRDGRLVAWYTPAGEAVGVTLAEHARASLPPYLVPAALVPLDRLPLTPNGKLDWRALPDHVGGAARDRPAAPPRHERDARMAAIWCEVLGLDRIGIDDPFFESGGDSFAAMRLARLVGDGLRVVSVFQHPTVRRLVDFLDDRGEDGLLHRLPGAADPTGLTTATVVAVPFGGASAAVYRELALALPADLPLYAVELPGHDVGDPDQPLQTFDTIAERCVEEIRRTITGPVVVYGHCVGAALAFDIAHRLTAEGADVVGVVAGGAFPAPRLPGRFFDLWARILPSDRWRADRLYRDLLRATGGFTEQLDPADQAVVLRALRHDARESEHLYSRLCHDSGHRRRVHALTVVGERDRITEFHQERYREWNLLCADTELAVIPDAGHYFLEHQAASLARTVAGWVRRRLGTAPPAAPPDAAVPTTNLRGFALVTFGQLVSLAGSRALAFALGIWVYLETGSVTQFSGILVAAILPGLLALPLAGAAADRWNRRLLMLAGEALNAAGTTFSLVMFATGGLHVWHIYVAASLTSVAASVQQPAYLAAIAQLVPKQYLARTNGVVQAVVAVSQAVGPLLGGALIVLVGLGGVMAANLAAVLIAVLTLAVVRFPDLLFRRRDESIWREIAGGVRYIARRRPFVAMIVFFLAFNLMLGFALALIPPMVLSFGSASTLSLATMIGAIGGVTGGIVMAMWGGFARRATGMVGFVGLTGVGMVVAGLWPEPLFPIVGLAAVMASIALINGHWQTMIQLKVGLELQGRILAANRMIANLTEPLGYVGAGLLADAVAEPFLAGSGLFDGGPGRGMALIVMVLGVVQLGLAAVGMRWRTLRYMEDALPDAIPGAVVTWDRDRLQRDADRLLEVSHR